MANLARRVAENVLGDFFVDSTCIDCDACRQIAPAVFGQAAETSYVSHQPEKPEDRRSALHALLSCPTGSIGCLGNDDAKAAMSEFPLLVEDPVYYCGFNSPKSFGGNSYFIRHPDGNWLIDSPKFIKPLVRRLEELGGVDFIFLTHRDDVADASQFGDHFKARRIIDRRELESQPDAEIILDGEEPTLISKEFLAIPTPGHSEGHCCLLFAERFLFTGDHVYWNRDQQELDAFRDYCWYSWEVQRNSMRKLTQFSFEWILPGHGQRVQLPASTMEEQMAQLVDRMQGRINLFSSGLPMKTVLFLCTGNYYRSRYAEILFNAKAEEMGLQWNAVSRGLAPDPRNPGPMFRDTMEALQKQGISYEDHLRLPMKVTEADFESNDHIIAVKEVEHRPMIERNFPTWLDQVEFWRVDDLDCCGSDETIPHLEREVAALLARLVPATPPPLI